MIEYVGCEARPFRLSLRGTECRSNLAKGHEIATLPLRYAQGFGSPQ